MPAVVLFTRDLRVHDHPALTAALRTSDEVVPLFVLDADLLERSPNRARFLLSSLADLDRSLRQRGGKLFVREGDPVKQAIAVAREVGSSAVHLTADVSAYARRRERRLRDGLSGERIGMHLHAGNAIVEPGEVAPDGKDAYRVFTPYHRAWSAAPRRVVMPAPETIAVPGGLEPGPRPIPGSFLPDAIDLPQGGERVARRVLGEYLAKGAASYGDRRNDLAGDGTSRLSPYLRFGCVSASEVAERAGRVQGAEELVRQLAWRDFFGQLLASDPIFQWADFRAAPDDTADVPVHADQLLRDWSAGRTGIPLVDAGMRQLHREGWMHNRARMVTASFLTRRLGIPWQEGAEVFMRYLVDGDPASNSGGWQWAAGTGTDPRRSRSFNPVRQAQRFDPDGVYIARYVRELRDVPVALRAAPWRDPHVLRRTGYPSPVLEPDWIPSRSARSPALRTA